MSETPEGYLICKNVPICRTGWQEYHARELGLGTEDGYQGDDVVRVYRDAKEVLDPRTIASYEGKTVTSPHPPTFLSPANDAQYNRGQIHNVRVGPVLANGEHSLIADIFVKDARLADQIRNKSLREVSCGYDCLYEPMGARQYAQKNIRGNHLAVIPAGRCGPACQIMDCSCKTTDGEEEQMDMNELVTFLKFWEGSKEKSTTDSDPGAVERNQAAAAEALRRAAKRNEDAMIEETAKADSKRLNQVLDTFETFMKDQKAKDAAEEEKKAKDAAEEKEEKKKAEDKKAKDAAEEEEKKKKAAEDEKEKEESEDADLIAVETMTGNEVPKNPIAGADKAKDAALATILAMRPIFAKGTRDQKLAFNSVVNTLKGKTEDKDVDKLYADLLTVKRPEETMDSKENGGRDTAKDAADFVAGARKYHRQNVTEIKSEKGA